MTSRRRGRPRGRPPKNKAATQDEAGTLIETPQAPWLPKLVKINGMITPYEASVEYDLPMPMIETWIAQGELVLYLNERSLRSLWVSRLPKLRIREPLEPGGTIGIRAASKKYGISAYTIGRWMVQGDVATLMRAERFGERTLVDEKTLRVEVLKYRTRKRRPPARGKAPTP